MFAPSSPFLVGNRVPGAERIARAKQFVNGDNLAKRIKGARRAVPRRVGPVQY